jgi:hypothetical protein
VAGQGKGSTGRVSHILIKPGSQGMKRHSFAAHFTRNHGVLRLFAYANAKRAPDLSIRRAL